MQIHPDENNWKSVNKIMIGAILPRPIGWISTIDQAGKPNLAPFSFFNAVCSNPPHILFCSSIRSTDVGVKDTLRNVRETGEFVANVVTAELAEAMNITSTEFPAEVNEFEEVNLTAVPSEHVRAPRVAESPVNFECTVAQIIDISDQPGGGSIVVGRIVHIHVDDEVIFGGDKIDLQKLQPVGRLAGPSYCHVTDVFEMVRPQSQLSKT
jgi:flavin reductase (DIM6/NTAB) family NADH-FMN oxidoreductase RutF